LLPDSQAKSVNGSFLVPSQLSVLVQQLRTAVLHKTNHRVWNLAIEVHPEQIVLRGDTSSFHAKQLAQESVRKVLPQLRLVNAIQVAA
jgi:hypothetical protein